MPTWLSEVDLWIANYGVTNPTIKGWKAWRFWQYTNKAHGRDYGVESADLDLDYFNGTEDELRIYANVTPPIHIPTIDERLTKLENWAETCGYEK
jgi:GH25 family lysozyme M1 (1,4-beta-N-acetylmuramidase)